MENICHNMPETTKKTVDKLKPFIVHMRFPKKNTKSPKKIRLLLLFFFI